MDNNLLWWRIRRGVQGLALVGLFLASIIVWTNRTKLAASFHHGVLPTKLEDLKAPLHPFLLRPLDLSLQNKSLGLEVKRRVLGLYNSFESDTSAENNIIHLKLELILNHLGMLVDYQDVNQPLPNEQVMAQYHGVVAWVPEGRMKAPSAYLKWLTQQIRAGRKLVLLEGLRDIVGLHGERATSEEQEEVMRALGMTILGQYTRDAHRIQIITKETDMVEFERQLPARLPYYERYQIVEPNGRSYLRLSRTDIPDSFSDMVAITSHGGFVAADYAVFETRLGRNEIMQWRINPFRFLAEALGIERLPRPDFTTLNGSRIFYSHIDGDGFSNITEIDRKSSCADYVRRQILQAYNLPFTTSFVLAELIPPPLGLGNKDRIEVARRIAKLPNVEMASHGFAHPMDWRAKKNVVCALTVPGYRMSAEKEIAASARYLDTAINPPGKFTRVILWTGSCNPNEEQLSLAYREGLYNMNGGDPLMTAEFPSYLHLAPPIHRVGRQRQYFTSGPNDYILTEEWHPPYHRWRNLINMLQNTETPRRIYPINVYFHFYIVEKEPAMVAMRDIMSWVLKQKPAPLWVSEYIDILRDFESVRMAQVAMGNEEQWRVLNNGYLRTIRFDRQDRQVDLARSRGVIGYRQQPDQGALYVHLDQSHDHLIVLSPTRATKPYLLHATSYVDNLRLSQEQATLILRGIGHKMLSFANLLPSTQYRVEAVNQTKKKRSTTVVSTDSYGTLHWQDEINGEQIKVKIESVLN